MNIAGAGVAGVASSAALFALPGVVLSIAGGVVITGTIMFGVAGAITTAACKVSSYKPCIIRGIHVGRGTKYEVRKCNNHLKLVKVCRDSCATELVSIVQLYCQTKAQAFGYRSS